MSDNDNLDRNDRSYDDGNDDYEHGGRRGGDSGAGQVTRRPPRGRRGRRRKEDYFAVNKVEPNYKDVDTLRRFLTDRAKIRPRRQTGLSSKNQRKLALEIKRARHLALLPFTDDQLRR